MTGLYTFSITGEAMRDTLRRLLEMAYFYTWGPQGNAGMRDEFKRLYLEVKPLVGDFLYDGDRIEWTPPEMTEDVPLLLGNWDTI